MGDVAQTLQLALVLGLCAFALAAALGRHMALAGYVARAVGVSARAVVAALTLGRLRLSSGARRQVNRTRRRARAMNARRRVPDEPPAPAREGSGWRTAPRERAYAAQTPAAKPARPLEQPPARAQIPPRIGPPGA